MAKNSRSGFVLIFVLVVFFIAAGISGTLLTINTAGMSREQSRDFKFQSRVIAEAALSMSLNSLSLATDGLDNDGDGIQDEGMTEVDIFTPSVIATIEGNLGRIGTVSWTLGNDSNGNGLPDFGETGVVPLNLSGGQIITYSVFSENDGLDGDSDGLIDEDDEARSVVIVALGRYDNYDSMVRYTGIFTETYDSPFPPTWIPQTAFLCGGELDVQSCTVIGLEANIHTNESIEVLGSVVIEGDVTASEGGAVDPTDVGGTVDLAAPRMDIPDISQSTVDALRDQAIADGKDVYLLNDDGSISLNGSPVSNPGDIYHGWSLQAGTWRLSGSSIDIDGLFCSGMDVSITGGNNSVNVTVFCDGNVTYTGTGNFGAYYQDIFVTSLMDIVVSGDPNVAGPCGAILAREQIEISGNTSIEGTVVAADLDVVSPYVISTQILGACEIIYDGGYTFDIPIINPGAERYKLEPTVSAYEVR